MFCSPSCCPFLELPSVKSPIMWIPVCIKYLIHCTFTIWGIIRESWSMVTHGIRGRAQIQVSNLPSFILHWSIYTVGTAMKGLVCCGMYQYFILSVYHTYLFICWTFGFFPLFGSCQGYSDSCTRFCVDVFISLGIYPGVKLLSL